MIKVQDETQRGSKITTSWKSYVLIDDVGMEFTGVTQDPEQSKEDFYKTFPKRKIVTFNLGDIPQDERDIWRYYD